MKYVICWDCKPDATSTHGTDINGSQTSVRHVGITGIDGNQFPVEAAKRIFSIPRDATISLCVTVELLLAAVKATEQVRQ